MITINYEVYKDVKIFYDVHDNVWYVEDEMSRFSSKYISIIKNYIDKL